MGRYRKKPIEVDAIQWKGDNRDEVVAFLLTQESRYNVPEQDTINAHHRNAYIDVETGHGVARCDLGGWLVIDADRYTYPVEPAIFEQTYEPVE